MNENLRESLSTLMDDEADDLELRRLLSSGEDKAVNELWSRYHLVRDVMHNDQKATAFQHLDISQRVSVAIAGEPDINVKLGSETDPSPWWRPVAGFAVAASVAMAVVVGVQSVSPTGGSINNGFDGGQSAVVSGSRVYPSAVQNAVSGPMQASAVLAASDTAISGITSPKGISASRAAADIEARKRLEEYMLRHTESAALNNGQSMIPFARVTSFEEE